MQLRFVRGSAGTVSELLVCLILAWLPMACVADGSTGDPAQTDASDSPGAAAEPADPSPSAGSTQQAAVDTSKGGEKPYEVDCGQVDENGDEICVTDKATYVGWRTFHATCHVCHGQNAVGSSFAPSLLKPIDKATFVDVVTNGRSGETGVMPAWGENPNVKDFIDELYAYQEARADGVLKPGRPKRKD